MWTEDIQEKSICTEHTWTFLIIIVSDNRPNMDLPSIYIVLGLIINRETV